MDIQKQFTDRVSPSILKAQVTLPFEPTIAAYRVWESELPVLNPKVADRLFSESIQALLSTDMQAADKFGIAEEAQSCLSRLLAGCKRSIEGAKLPLPTKQTEISSELLNVLSDFNSVYMDVICSSDFLAVEKASDEDSASPVFPDQQKGLVIFRALEFLSTSQFLKALIYKSPESEFWNYVNALFSLAEQLQLHQISYPMLSEKKVSSAENEFKKIHLFHLARTNRFRQREIETIHTILAEQTVDVLLSNNHDDSFDFYVDVAAPSAITHTSALPQSNNNIRFLNNECLIQYMLSDDIIAPERHGAISLISSKPLLTKKTIQMLLPSWSTTQSRQASRQSQSDEVLVYPGFDSIIKALVNKQKTPTDNKKTNPSKTPIGFGVSDLELIPIDSSGHHHNAINSSSAINKMLKASSENELSSNSIWRTKKPVKFGEKGEEMGAEINDSSLQGLRFTLSSDNKSLLNASDIIGIKTKTQSLQLAIIRRMNNLTNGDVSVGVEMMSPQLKIASIKFHDKEKAAKPVIFLQGIPAINQPDAIISPLLLENLNEDIVIKSNNKTSYYSIDKIIATNQVFTHYSVSKQVNVD
ncbi:MAG: hypothetical protein A6F70_05295 [Cycloclasticus sp. symbiont of Bathymodiolus heckerae]|nr:MAG: hypothetical protein A6F70_05295 [Cycloclasticus sp. symbiont of Bathymodiolus heckerae]